MTFILPNPENVTGGAAALQYLNDLTAINGEPILGVMILGVVFAITFFTLIFTTGRSDSTVVVSFWTTTITGMFLAMIPSMLNPSILIGLIMATALLTIFMYRYNK